MKKIISKIFVITIIALLSKSPAGAYESCVIITDGKMSDISIEDNSVVNVYPLVTADNKKNTLIVEPLKSGSTRFCVLKNNKNIVMFKIKITPDETEIGEVEGFDIYTIDNPPEYFEFDPPPLKLGGEE